jgi:endonuclease III
MMKRKPWDITNPLDREEYKRELQEIVIAEIPSHVLADLRELHGRYWCTAHDEGQECCFDLLLGTDDDWT